MRLRADSGGVGQIVTFYSFKGGTGRTMALANVAWILAANGKRVLVADWDLESPGLHRFFQPFMKPDDSGRPGIVDFIREYEWAIDEADSRGLLEVDEKSEPTARGRVIASVIDNSVRRVERIHGPGQLADSPTTASFIFFARASKTTACTRML